MCLWLIYEMRNRGLWMWDFLHCGQRPGRVKRLRCSNTYPHARQPGGVITIFLPWEATERAMWDRCSITSFSDIPTSPETSRAVISASLNSDMIFCLRVGMVVHFRGFASSLCASGCGCSGGCQSIGSQVQRSKVHRFSNNCSKSDDRRHRGSTKYIT